MKATFIIIAILIATATTALGQNSELKKEQIQSIQKLINIFKTNNKMKIADLIYYPLKREYPLQDVKDKNDFIKRFDDIFDKEFLEHVAKSKITDWSEVGWRGIMLDNGVLWIDDDGKIMAVNSQSLKEKQLLTNAIQADKNRLPKSLQNFEKPLYLIFTKNYKIRIDEKFEGIYRYVAWKIKNQKRDPDIVIENGVLEFQGSGGNHTIAFENNGYTYTVSINVLGTVDTPDATLEVSKQEKTMLLEDGKIKRN
jgi:hypothetical protein